MPRARRSLTDPEILSMQLSTSAAKRLRGEWPPDDDGLPESATPTAIFLWLAFAACVLLFAGTFLWEAMGWTEQDCDDDTDTGARVECTQRGDGDSGRESEDVGHGAQSGGSGRGAA